VVIQNKLKKIGKSDRIGSLDLIFKKVRGRREFFDLVREYIFNNNGVNEVKLNGYLQYTTGATESSIKQALAVLESIDLIKCKEETNPPFLKTFYFIKEIN